MEELERQSAEEAQRSGKHTVVLILDNIRSMHNVGSAFRTADAFAAEALYLCGYTPQPPHRDIHKTALGATETVHWKHFAHIIDAVQNAKEQGYKIFAVEQAHDSVMLHDFHWNGDPVALVLGNEVTGVSEEVLSLADGVIEIPQFGSKHSLNISVSLGVVLWELVRSKLNNE